MKKLTTLAVTSICTISMGVTAFGACPSTNTNQYKYCTHIINGSCSNSNVYDYLSCIKNGDKNCNYNWILNQIYGNSCSNSTVTKPSDTVTKPSDTVTKPSDTEAKPTETPNDEDKVENPINNNQTDKEAELASEVLRLVNEEREAMGLKALTQNSELQGAAQIRSKEQVTSFSHTRPNGSSCFTVLSENGISYKGAGENIAFGQKTPSAVVEAWMNSEGHRANILSTNFTQIGVGCYVSPNGTIYWTQLFIY